MLSENGQLGTQNEGEENSSEPRRSYRNSDAANTTTKKKRRGNGEVYDYVTHNDHYVTSDLTVKAPGTHVHIGRCVLRYPH